MRKDTLTTKGLTAFPRSSKFNRTTLKIDPPLADKGEETCLKMTSTKERKPIIRVTRGQSRKFRRKSASWFPLSTAYLPG